MKSKRSIVIVSIYLIASAVGLAIGMGVRGQLRNTASGGEPRSEKANDAEAQGRNQVASLSAGTAMQKGPSFIAGWVYRVPIEEIPRWVTHFSGSGNRAAFDALFIRWIKTDPEPAWEAALALPPGDTASVCKYEDGSWSRTSMDASAWLRVRMMRAWMKTDPDAAMSAILALPGNGMERRRLLSYTLRSYAAYRPADAVRIVFEELRPSGRYEVGGIWLDLEGGLVGSLFGRWGESDPRAALARATEITERNLRDNATKSAFRAWAEADPVAARLWFENLSPSDQTSELRGAMLSALARTDPGSAMVLSFENDPENVSTLSNMAWRWGEQDAEGMLRALDEVEAHPLRSAMITRSFQKLANSQTGPEMAALALGLPAEVQQSAMQPLARHWATQDAAAAEAWGLGLEDPFLRRQFLHEFYRTQIRGAPADVAANASRIPDTKLRGRIAADAVSVWSRENPAEAAEWVVSSSDGIPPEALVEMHRYAAAAYTKRAPEAAIAWFAKLEGDAVQKGAAQEIAWQLRALDPERGAALIDASMDLSDGQRALLLEHLTPPAVGVDPFAIRPR